MALLTLRADRATDGFVGLAESEFIISIITGGSQIGRDEDAPLPIDVPDVGLDRPSRQKNRGADIGEERLRPHQPNHSMLAMKTSARTTAVDASGYQKKAATTILAGASNIQTGCTQTALRPVASDLIPRNWTTFGRLYTLQTR